MHYVIVILVDKFNHEDMKFYLHYIMIASLYAISLTPGHIVKLML